MKKGNNISGKLTRMLFQGGRSPGQLIIQYSDACNATCPQCELRVTSSFVRSKIGMEDTKRMIDSAVRNGVQSLSFTGGEPLLYRKEIIELIRYASQAGIDYIRTGTNGYLFIEKQPHLWEKRIRVLAEELAKTDLYTFWISIDSCVPEVHEQMRGLPGVIKGIERALPIFHEYGIYPAANLGINRNIIGDCQEYEELNRPELDLDLFYDLYRQGFGRFYEFVTNLGFTITNACYPMSIQSEDKEDLSNVYGASSADRIVSFSAAEKVRLFEALLDTIPQYRSRLRIFTPQTSLYTLSKFYGGNVSAGYPCRGGIDYFFVDARSGDTYPCGFRGGDNLGKFWDLNVSAIKEKPFCRQCDWECFRDPGELMGPLLEGLRHPIQTWKKFKSDPEAYRYWRTDLAYYRACDYFCGRKPADSQRLAAFRNEPISDKKTHDAQDVMKQASVILPSETRPADRKAAYDRQVI